MLLIGGIVICQLKVVLLIYYMQLHVDRYITYTLLYTETFYFVISTINLSLMPTFCNKSVHFVKVRLPFSGSFA